MAIVTRFFHSFFSNRSLPAHVTGRDVLKCAAVFLMVVDHIGWHFFADDMLWRAFGRISVPIWLFLVGFTASRRVDAAMAAGFVFLVALDLILGRVWFPLNILGTIIVVRLALGPLARFIGHDTGRIVFVMTLCAVFAPFTTLLLEYGTAALAFALAGHYARHGFPGGPRYMPAIITVVAWALFLWVQFGIFPRFDAIDNAIMVAGTAAATLVAWVLAKRAEPVHIPAIRATAPIVRFCGRHTIGLYVGHLAVFRIIAFFMAGG